MADPTQLTRQEIQALAARALRGSGASPLQAEALARGVAAAEADGLASHGLAYVPTYCQHLGCGKVKKDAVPQATVRGNVVRVDADSGFAHAAIELGFERMVPIAKASGIAALAVTHSYNCGVLGYHTEALASKGLVALGFTNAPASIAPWGGRKPLFGTNPWSLAVPSSQGGVAFVIDQSASVVAKSEVMKRQREGREIPAGWALDAHGDATTDPRAALAGTMLPAGGYKGVGSALLVEIFAACLTGAHLGIEASPFSGTAGGPPGTGQFFIAIEPAFTAGDQFSARLASLIAAYAEIEGARLPGSRRRQARAMAENGVIDVSEAVARSVMALAG
jgi:(2R)-3-sulfolactate dehydrogenase (NADP+)